MTTDRAQSDGPVAGWYPDPHEQADLRWFDGTAWTDQTRAHPTADEAEQSRSTSTGAGDEELDEELLALIAAEDRRRRIIFGAIGLVVVLALAWFFFLRGDSTGDDGATVTPPSQSTEDAATGDADSGTAPTPLDPPVDDGTSDGAPAVDAAQRVALESVARIVAGVETCAGDSGSFEGCEAAGVLKVVPGLRPLLAKCGQPGGGCIRLIGSDGFEVKVQDASPQPRTWVEIHVLGADGSDANVTRTCEPAGCTPTGSWSPDDIA